MNTRKNGDIEIWLLLSVGLLQGILLFLLTEAHERGLWPSDTPMAWLPLATATIVVPVGILLGATAANRRRLLTGALLYGLFAALTATYIGYLFTPLEGFDQYGSDSIGAFFLATGLAVSFIALIHLQLWAGRDTLQPGAPSAAADSTLLERWRSAAALAYPLLFRLSWRNLLTVAACYMFTGVVFLLLMLWGELFKLVGIDIFATLFAERWFVIPAVTVAFATGCLVFRRMTAIIDTLSRALRALCFFTLPLIASFLLLFLAVLPVTGLAQLWDTGHGTAIVLALLTIYLLFFNATYQEDEGFAGYPIVVEKLVLLGLAFAPAYGFIALYGTWLRIDQYGLTVERCYALAACLLLLGLAGSYAGLIARERLGMPAAIGTVNVVFSGALAALLALSNTPLLDFRRIALHNQLAAWEQGRLTDEQLDVDYIARHLGRPGHLALQELRASGSPTLAERIDHAEASHMRERRAAEGERGLTRADLLTYQTANPLPEALALAIIADADDADFAGDRVHLLELELNGRPPTEWLAVHAAPYWHSSTLWYLAAGEWFPTAVLQWDFPFDTDWESFLATAPIEILAPRWQRIKIGEQPPVVME